MLSDPQRRELDAWASAVLPRALAYARSLVPDPSRADDLVQESLYRLLRWAADYDLVRDGVRLLFRAVSNLCINEATRRRALASLDTGGADDGPLPVEDRFAEPPEQAARRHELQDAVARPSRSCRRSRRRPRTAALGQGKADIAAVLRVSETNAGVLVFRRGRRWPDCSPRCSTGIPPARCNPPARGGLSSAERVARIAMLRIAASRFCYDSLPARRPSR